MPSTLSLTVTEDGLRLPRQLFAQPGEVEVIERDDYILIKPKSATAAEDTRQARALAAMRASGLIIVPAWPAPPSVSALDRAELARKLGGGRPLSEDIIEERDDRV